MTKKPKRQIEIMTSKYLRPMLMALAVSTSPAFSFMAQAAEEMDHSKMDHGSMGAMDHSKMGAMDHSKMSMDNGAMDGMESMDGGA
ncbi:copper resistance protein CopB, partial [Pseudomonas sp. GW247-3R2A]